jgi:hypothetical protein
MKTRIKTPIPSLLIAVILALACTIGLEPTAQAVSPAPDGGYPGGNTAEGQSALLGLTTGRYNTAVGFLSLRSTNSGSLNTGIGAGTLLANTGDSNTAIGTAALLSNTAGSLNTANGAFALFNNTSTLGSENDAFGAQALFNNITGNSNQAFGVQALFSNTTGGGNIAVGALALRNLATGDSNTAVGINAGINLTTGSGNIYIAQGSSGQSAESNHTYIGNINTTSVSGANSDSVTVDLTTGLLGHLSSSQRYKEDVKPMDKVSEAVFALKPATYRYRKDIDPSQSPAFGLVAEEVAKVNPNLVAYNSKGEPESVHYEMVNAMLLNEFLKEHRKTEKLEATVVRQQKQIESLAAGLQKVGAQLQISTAAPQTVLNSH